MKAALLVLLASAAFAFADGDDLKVVAPPIPFDAPDVYLQDRYVPVPNYAYRFVPYPTHFQRGHYYFWDYVNRPYAFTPEPIWREMFRGIRERIGVEIHAIGVPGQAAGEYNYYKAIFKDLGKRRREEK
jgi:hypothetical protein